MEKFSWEKREPTFNPIDYNSSIIKFLSFFNSDVSSTDRRRIALEYWKTQGKDVSGMGRIHDYKFAQLGVLARISVLGHVLDPKHQTLLDTAYDTLFKERVVEVEVEKPVVHRKTTEEKHQDLFNDICETFENELYRISKTGKRIIDARKYYALHSTPHPVCKKVSDWFASRKAELVAVIDGSDDQLKEGYSHVSSKAVKLMHAFICEIDALVETTKKVRKPRKKKVKPASVIAAKVKYMADCDEFCMQSELPEKIVGADVVYLFNVKLRKLFYYVANKGDKLTIKGTTIIGFDAALSGSKVVRKPEVFFSPLSGYDTMNRREFYKSFESIRAKLIEGPGRISGDMIIVRVF